MTKKQTATPAAAKQTTKKEPSTPTIDQVIQDQLAQDPTLELTLSWTQVKPVYDKFLRQVAKNLKPDGFRPGKIPLSVAEERVNREALTQEVVRQLAPAVFADSLKKSQLTAFAEPELVITKADKGSDWLITAYLPQKTTIDLPDYKKFIRTHKKQARQQLEAVQKQDKKNSSTDSKPLTDKQLQAKATDQALMELLGELKPKVSTVLVRRSVSRELDKLHQQLAQANLSFSDYLRQTGMTEQVLVQQLMLSCLQNLQLEFILDALLTAENITATDADIAAKLTELMPDVTDEAEKKRQLDEPTVRDYLDLMAKRQKLAHWLLEL